MQGLGKYRYQPWVEKDVGGQRGETVGSVWAQPCAASWGKSCEAWNEAQVPPLKTGDSESQPRAAL